ncbi:oligosaccharide flippase family protein [Sulfuricaulis sp.]|jgi:O-antigen/teichoic acid export membrane protein|uniref:oligosaccharide flippase family protein n=1 Tax=Sulfuricaulis sp. TaxID=2003553 RepID=UPI003559BCC8
MSALRRAFTQGSLYTLFQGLGMAVSLISFPILTRVLSVEEYGNLALFNATVSILMSAAKCGITTSFIRSYAAVETADDSRRRQLYSSAFGASVALGLGIAVVYTIVIFFLGDYFGRALTTILLFAGLPILIGDLRDLFFAFLRAQEKVLTLSLVGLVMRVGSVTTGILACVMLLGGLTGYIVGVIAFEATLVLLLGLHFARRGLFSLRQVSPSVAGQLLVFGAPLLLFELSSLVNDNADRFLINHFLGSAQVGIYSVGYNFAMYVQGMITAPLWMTIFPIYTKIWETEGPAKTSEFLVVVLKYYLALAILIIVGVSVTSRELITLLATDKFAAAASITPFVIISVMLYGTTHITAAGFYLAKRTKTIAALTLSCALVNILINLVLIPSYGILGAAYATVASYFILTVLVTAFSRDLLHVKWPLRSLAIYVAAAAVSAFMAIHVEHPNLFVSLILKSFVTTASYAIIVLVLDRGLRETVVRLGTGLYRKRRA